MRNSVKKQGYHHGDLRAALLATGLRLLEEKADGEIGLREVARETGVSATAVYRHFPDKDALFAALASEGFERLADAQEAAAKQMGGKREAFRAIGQAYVRFALAHPALFRLMTSHMHLTGDDEGERDNRAAVLLRDRIAKLLPPDVEDERRSVAAVQAWALVHGLATLILGGQIPNDSALIDAAVDEFRFHS
jgi:AcrR family transcriptional regulator